MSFLPNLGNLALARPTGMEAASNSASSAPKEVMSTPELMAYILAMTNNHDYEAACNAAETWGQTATEASDAASVWVELAKRVFGPLNENVQMMTPTEIEEGHNPRLWFFELCKRARKLREAKAHLKDLEKRETERMELLRDQARLLQRLVAQNNADTISGFTIRRIEKKIRELRYNIKDPLHPTVPLRIQVKDCQALVDAANKALGADPLNKKIGKDLKEAYDIVFTSTAPEFLRGNPFDGHDDEDEDDDDDSSIGADDVFDGDDEDNDLFYGGNDDDDDDDDDEDDDEEEDDDDEALMIDAALFGDNDDE